MADRPNPPDLGTVLEPPNRRPGMNPPLIGLLAWALAGMAVAGGIAAIFLPAAAAVPISYVGGACGYAAAVARWRVNR